MALRLIGSIKPPARDGRQRAACQLNDDCTERLADPKQTAWLEKLERTDMPMSPEETPAFVHAEQAKWAPILKQIGIAH